MISMLRIFFLYLFLNFHFFLKKKNRDEMQAENIDSQKEKLALEAVNGQPVSL